MRKSYKEAMSAVPLKGLDDPPTRAMIAAHKLTHLPAAPWCESVFKPEGKGLAHASQVR